MKPVIAALVAAAIVVLGAPAAGALPAGTEVRTYKGGLNFPVDLAWVKGSKKIFFTEKDSGKVRVMKGRTLLDKPCVNLDVNASGERGALGIELHPDFKDNHYLYVFYTNASPLENRVDRFTVKDNRCRNRTRIVKGLNASSDGYHNGGQLEFVKKKLFVSTGEAHDPAEAQDTSNRLGKILRYKANGSIPDDNPFNAPGNKNAVWSFGHRNPFGLTHEPGTSRLYQTENGPSCDDEFNLIKRGRNYGWGSGYQCGTKGVGPNPKGPLRRWGNIVVPTDPTFYKGRMKSLSGDIYVPTFDDGLHRLILNRKGTKVKKDRRIHGAGEMTDATKGPKGWLYFATAGGIFRIVPK